MNERREAGRESTTDAAVSSFADKDISRAQALVHVRMHARTTPATIDARSSVEVEDLMIRK